MRNETESIGGHGSLFENFESRRVVRANANDQGRGFHNNGTMDDSSDEPDWYLRDWMTRLGKRQAALTNELGWLKSRANKVWHSDQPYRREQVNEISNWLGIRPFELLMPPEEALALRRLRETAALIVADGQAEFYREPIDAPPLSAAEAKRPRKRA